MASKNNLSAALAANYDKIAAGIGVVLLALSVFVFVGGKSSSAEAVDSFRQNLNSLRPKYEGIDKYIDLTPYSNALIQITRPVTIANDTNKVVGFFVPERRIWCAYNSCQYPIHLDTAVCPKCKKPQEKVETDIATVSFTLDMDGDGLPDEWERENGLNPQDPSDADADKDGDGFTNKEEFLAKTNPSDANSHPPYIDSLTVDKKGISVKRLPVKFLQRTGAPGNYTYMMSFVDEDGKTYSSMTPEGDYIKYKPQGIAKKEVITAYKVIGSVENEEEVKFGTGTRKVQVIYAKVDRNGTVFELKKDSLTNDTDYSVILYNTKLDKAIKVDGNADFEVDNSTWKIIRVDKDANSVVLKNNADSREIKVPSR